MPSKETEKIEKEIIRNTLNFAINCLKQTESVLEMKRNEIDNRIKYTTQGILAVTYIKQTTNVLKCERAEMEMWLKSDSLELWDGSTHADAAK